MLKVFPFLSTSITKLVGGIPEGPRGLEQSVKLTIFTTSTFVLRREFPPKVPNYVLVEEIPEARLKSKTRWRGSERKSIL